MLSPLTQKQEIFCLEYVKANNGLQAAIAAGYSPHTAKVIASENLTKPYLKARIDELRAKIGITEPNLIATVEERKQILTEIARGRFLDFTSLTTEKLKSAALQSIRITEFTKGELTTKKTTINLHNPIHAIGELNKMEKIYTEGTTVNIDNRRLEITVGNEDTKKLLEEIEEGIAPHAYNPNLQ